MVKLCNGEMVKLCNGELVGPELPLWIFLRAADEGDGRLDGWTQHPPQGLMQE